MAQNKGQSLIGIWLFFTCLSFVSCVSQGIDEETQARIDTAEDLARTSSEEAETLRSKLDILTGEKEALLAEIDTLKKESKQTSAENEELKTQVSRLRALLDDIESLQLALLYAELEPPSPSPSIPPSPSPTVAPIASPEPLPSPDPTPSPEPSPQPVPSPSPDVQPSPLPSEAPVASPDPTPAPTPSPNVSPQPTPFQTATSEPAFITGPAPGRTDRRNVRATPLFSELERATSATWYYHREAWYDREGIFASVSRTGNAEPRLFVHVLRLVNTTGPTSEVSRSDEGPAETVPARAVLSFGAGLEMNGSFLRTAFGMEASAKVRIFELEMDETNIQTLLRALSSVSVVYRIGTEAGSEPIIPDTLVDARSKRAMIEVLSAFRDMKSAPR